MPTTTWRTIRREILRELGSFEFSTTTNLASAATPVIISTTLARQYPRDDFFNDYWLLIEESGHTANAGIVFRVNDYIGASGQLVVEGGAFAAPATAASDILVSQFHPTQVLNFFNRAKDELYPHLSIVRDFYTIVTGQKQHMFTLPTTSRGRPIAVYMGQRTPADNVTQNLLTDGGFEIWTSSSVLTNWTGAGTGAASAREAATTSPKNYMVLEGQYSVQLATATSGETTLLQSPTPDVAVQGVEVNISVWVYCLVSGRVSARVAGTDGDTHGGTGWELLTASATNPTTVVTITAGVAVSAGSEIRCFIDEAILVAGQSEALDHPWQPILNYEWIPPVAGASDGGKLYFPYALPEQRRLRIITRDLLSTVSAETDTVEVDAEQRGILYNKTRAMLAEEASRSGGTPDDASYWERQAAGFNGKVQQALNNGMGMRVPKSKPKIPNWEW
jgi:hypothetical protein